MTRVLTASRGFVSYNWTFLFDCRSNRLLGTNRKCFPKVAMSQIRAATFCAIADTDRYCTAVVKSASPAETRLEATSRPRSHQLESTRMWLKRAFWRLLLTCCCCCCWLANSSSTMSPVSHARRSPVLSHHSAPDLSL